MSVHGQSFYNASGIHSENSAKMVFVWRVRGPDDWVLLGSGHLVGNVGRPKGIQAGQFSVTFALPPGYGAGDVVVTDDSHGEAPVPAVIRGPCSKVVELKMGRNSAGGGAVRAPAAYA